jgi:nucleoid-associated protein Lsr2
VSTKTLVSLVDDIDGTEAQDTITFGLDGAAYEIDLNPEHAAGLRDVLAPYVGAARRHANGAPVRRPGRSPAGRVARSTAPARPSAIGHVASAHVDGAERRSAVRAWGRGPGARSVKAAGLDPVSERGRIAVKVYELYDARPK